MQYVYLFHWTTKYLKLKTNLCYWFFFYLLTPFCSNYFKKAKNNNCIFIEKSRKKSLKKIAVLVFSNLVFRLSNGRGINFRLSKYQFYEFFYLPVRMFWDIHQGSPSWNLISQFLSHEVRKVFHSLRSTSHTNKLNKNR